MSTVEMARLIRTTNPKVNAIVTLVPEMAAAAAAKSKIMAFGRLSSGW
jgi:hypothetical protein